MGEWRGRYHYTTTTSLNIEDRDNNIDLVIGQIDGNLKEYGGRRNSKDEDRRKDALYIITGLQKYKTALQNLKLMPQYLQSGSGCGYCNPNELVEKLALLIASRQAGNDSTDIYNEIIEILDKLLNLKLINKRTHRRIFDNAISFRV